MLVLAMLATAMTTVVSASSSSQHRRLETGGSTDCPCVSEYAQGITVGQPKIPGETLVYPATYGLNHCLMHDLGLPPSCGNTLNISALPTWCTFTWCYIDKDNCAKTDVLESSYFPGMHYSGQTCGGDTDWSGFMTEQQCKTDCPANTTLPRIAFITHGNTGNHFWTDPSWGIYGHAQTAAHHWGMRLVWVNTEGDPAVMAQSIREYAETSPEVPLVVTIPTAEVGAAVDEAAARGVRVYGINDMFVAPGASAPSIEAFVAMDAEKCGELAAKFMLERNVTRPVFVDHGTPIGAVGRDEQMSWAIGRHNGFARVIKERLGFEPVHLPIGESEATLSGWTGMLNVYATVQGALLDPAIGLRGNGTVDDPRCRYDGIFSVGQSTTAQVAYALQRLGCWQNPDSATGVTIFGGVDYDPLAQKLVDDGLMQFLFDQRAFLQAYIPVALAAVADAKAPLLGSINVNTISMIEQDTPNLHTNYMRRCGAFCVIDKALHESDGTSTCGALTGTEQIAIERLLTTDVATRPSAMNPVNTSTMSVCTRTPDASHLANILLSDEEKSCAMDVGFTFCDPWVEPVVQLPPRVEYYSVIIAAIIVLLFCCGGILYLHHQRTLRRKNMLRWEDSGYTPVIKPPAKDGGWHLFLSHKWPTGQTHVAIIYRQLQVLLPTCKCFLDVNDLDDINKLDEYIDKTDVILIFLSRAYFKSRGTMMEVRAARKLNKPIIVMYIDDVEQGGGSLEDLMSDCPPDLRQWLLARGEPLRWSVKPNFQRVALVETSELMLHYLQGAEGSAPHRGSYYVPSYYRASHVSEAESDEHGKRVESAIRKITIPKSVATHDYDLGERNVILYYSEHNADARECLEILINRLSWDDKVTVKSFGDGDVPGGASPQKKSKFSSFSSFKIKQVEKQKTGISSTVTTPKRTSRASLKRNGIVVVLLNGDTFEGDRGYDLSRTLMGAITDGHRIVLIHDVVSCPFAEFFDETPRDLINMGLFKNVAVDFVRGRAEEVCAVHFAKEVGAVAKKHTKKHKKSLKHEGDATSNTTTSSAEHPAVEITEVPQQSLAVPSSMDLEAPAEANMESSI